ncbi:Uncharacterized protein PBTT_00532 [Plasmodiophora brassicae]
MINARFLVVCALVPLLAITFVHSSDKAAVVADDIGSSGAAGHDSSSSLKEDLVAPSHDGDPNLEQVQAAVNDELGDEDYDYQDEELYDDNDDDVFFDEEEGEYEYDDDYVEGEGDGGALYEDEEDVICDDIGCYYPDEEASHDEDEHGVDPSAADIPDTKPIVDVPDQKPAVAPVVAPGNVLVSVDQASEPQA